MIKKIFSMVAVCALALMLVACGPSQEEKDAVLAKYNQFEEIVLAVDAKIDEMGELGAQAGIGNMMSTDVVNTIDSAVEELDAIRPQVESEIDKISAEDLAELNTMLDTELESLAIIQPFVDSMHTHVGSIANNLIYMNEMTAYAAELGASIIEPNEEVTAALAEMDAKATETDSLMTEADNSTSTDPDEIVALFADIDTAVAEFVTTMDNVILAMENQIAAG